MRAVQILLLAIVASSVFSNQVDEIASNLRSIVPERRELTADAAALLTFTTNCGAAALKAVLAGGASSDCTSVKLTGNSFWCCYTKTTVASVTVASCAALSDTDAKAKVLVKDQTWICRSGYLNVVFGTIVAAFLFFLA
jgi:hypothetical protein